MDVADSYFTCIAKNYRDLIGIKTTPLDDPSSEEQKINGSN
jgi:hypothetical protein